MLFSMEIEERSVCKWTFRAGADPTKHPHFADHCLSFVKFYRPIPDIDGFPVNRIHGAGFSLKMVQRKVPNKLGIQADHVKSEKRLGNLKPSSCQHQDGKNRGPDMKKKAKRSRSIKISDIESLKSSSPLRKAISQPGKLPPLNVTTTAAAPQKQLMIRTTDGSPNYMKSTSSSEARKERSQVSPLNTQTGSNGKSLHYRNSGNSRFSPASGSKPARTLSKTSSLKLVRTPSFKPTRGAAKKCSRVALCADVSTQKATCSSTLKDSKFPAYLMLNPGGTEAEGTSVMKVCPYTHCSLNGHQHKPATPMRCFLKARRRSLKVQNSMKLEDLSPRRARPSGDGTEEINGGLLDFSEDKPVIQEVGKDFFIEIYANNTEYGAYETEKRTEKEGKTADAFLGEPLGQMNESCFYAGHEAAVEQDNNNHVSESSSDESQESEIDFEENFSDTNAAEINVAVGFVREEEKHGDTDCSLTFSEGEAIMGSCDNRSDIEGECQASMEEDDNISEETGMEWEEDQPSTSEVGAEDDDLNKHDKFWTKVEFTPEIEKLDWSEDSEIITSDDVVSNCTEEVLADEVLREFFSEETASIDMQCSDSDSESDTIPHYWQILQSIQVAGNLAYDQPSAAEDAFEAPKTEEKDEEAGRDLIDAVATSSPIRESIVEPIGARENIQENNETDKSLGDGENGCTADISAEALNGHQEDKSLQAENAAIRPHISEKRDLIGTNKEDEIDQLIEVGENNQEFATAEFPDGEAGDATEDQEQVANAELQFEIHVSDSSQNFSEADQDDAELNAGGNHMTTSEEDSSSQDLVDDTTPTEPLDHQLDEQDETNNVLENENLFEEDKDEAKKIEILTAMDFEAPSNSRTHKINSTGDDTGEVEKMEVEVCHESDTAETFLSANNGATSTGSKRPFVYTRGNPNEELQYTCNNRKWTIGEKKPIKDLEEEREFNPREPNFLPVVPDPEAEKLVDDGSHQGHAEVGAALVTYNKLVN
ncbi:calmodulin binding protein PICBP isoform X1 [Populus alba x Populus x berolinensis]|nr:calmodulin binding protein PICBP isoform X1 [Populus alba x Populus x berolinensis]